MDSGAIDIAAERLGAGGLVAFPTETVYGLGADARDEDAVARVYAIKGRPAHNPLIVHVSGEEMARQCALDWPAAAGALAREFWPGPLTIVVRRGPSIPAIVAGGGDTVALRMPDHPMALALIERFGSPIVGPSANASGSVSPTTAAHVRAEFGDEVMVLDGGPCEAGIESAVVDVSEGGARVLRPGVIGAAEIARVIGGEVLEGAGPERGGADAGGELRSPGLLERHYAPRTPARLIEDLAGIPADAVVLAISPIPAGARGIRMPEEAGAYARRLYAALREADAMGAGEILIERPPSEGATPENTAIWRAIGDRLGRAAG